ncbi:MAG: hypothetical protein IJV36_07270 [Prevotella sp.]|nr:hypothetical protein [Prevotella sp.]
MSKDYTLLSVADSRGKAKVKISDDEYSAFLLSHRPNTDTYIPFAIDYKSRSVVGTSLQQFTGYLLSGMGIILMGSGTIALIAGDEDVALPLAGGGAALAFAGMGIGMPAESRIHQVAYDHQYKYLKQQRTNQDLSLTKPNFAIDNPVSVAPTVPEAVQKEQDTTQLGSSTSSKKLSQRSSKTLKDKATQIQGTYVGRGKLTKGKEVIETYVDIAVSINRIGKDKVGVMVTEKDGSKFFDTTSEYTISSASNGVFRLVLDGINSAEITIDRNKKLKYLHPRVNIDGDIYTLSIEATMVK